MQKVTKDMIISDVLAIDNRIASFFFAIGMHCLGCSSANGETVEEACGVHDVDVDDFVTSINDFLETQEK